MNWLFLKSEKDVEEETLIFAACEGSVPEMVWKSVVMDQD